MLKPSIAILVLLPLSFSAVYAQPKAESCLSLFSETTTHTAGPEDFFSSLESDHQPVLLTSLDKDLSFKNEAIYLPSEPSGKRIATRRELSEIEARELIERNDMRLAQDPDFQLGETRATFGAVITGGSGSGAALGVTLRWRGLESAYALNEVNPRHDKRTLAKFFTNDRDSVLIQLYSDSYSLGWSHDMKAQYKFILVNIGWLPSAGDVATER